jgi:hypothetical protein
VLFPVREVETDILSGHDGLRVDRRCGRAMSDLSREMR